MTSGTDSEQTRLKSLVRWVWNKLFPYGLRQPDGCPNCGFLLVTKPEYDQCPFCGWGPDAEPEKTATEARNDFLRGVFRRE